MTFHSQLKKKEPPAATGGHRKEKPLPSQIVTEQATQLPIYTVFADDSPRARRSDPITSHIAADRTAADMSEMKQRILSLFYRLGPMTDSELNAAYIDQAQVHGWKTVRPDTPRKRRSDLARDGWLQATGETRVNAFGSPEQVWEVAR